MSLYHNTKNQFNPKTKDYLATIVIVLRHNQVGLTGKIFDLSNISEITRCPSFHEIVTLYKYILEIFYDNFRNTVFACIPRARFPVRGRELLKSQHAQSIFALNASTGQFPLQFLYVLLGQRNPCGGKIFLKAG